MTNEQAINVLVQVAELAQARGILKMNEASVIFQAISLLAPKEQTEVPVQASAKSTAKSKTEK